MPSNKKSAPKPKPAATKVPATKVPATKVPKAILRSLSNAQAHLQKVSRELKK